MMNSSPVRSDKNRGRRHERLGEGLVRRRHLDRVAEIHRADSERGGRRKNPSDVPPRTAACRAHHQTSFNQVCPIIHVGQGVPTTRGARRKAQIAGFPALPRRWAWRGRAMVGSRRNMRRRSAMPAAAQQRQPADVPQTGEDARRAIRSGQWTGPTSGLAPGYVQGNLAILPSALASDFMRFCQLNPKPCPLLAAGAPGDPRLPTLGRRSRHPHRPLPLQGVPQRRTGRRADRHRQALARRSRDLRARLLVLVRGRADAGRHRAAPHHQRLDGADVSHQRADHRRPARSTARWWCRCGR